MQAIGHKILKLGDLSVDFDRGCIRRGEEEVALRPKAFEVLSHLAHNAGRLVRKQELIEAVWPDVTVSDDSLVQCIRELRQKLGDDTHRLIKTVPRRGYLLDATHSTPPSQSVPTDGATDLIERLPGFAASFGALLSPLRRGQAGKWRIWVAAGGLLCVLVAAAYMIALLLGPFAHSGLRPPLSPSADVSSPHRSLVGIWPARAPTEQRAALLIGNTHYTSWGVQLKNPKNDVIAVGRQLRSLGFATTVIYDGTSDQIATAIQAFRDEATAADWAVIYYAGTGIEVDGINYMIPVDADDRRALSFASDYPQMRLDTAFEAVQGAKRLRLVIADACRIDPSDVLGRANPDTKPQTLKVTEPPRGVLVAYSTAAGHYAQDGAGEISPFAQALIGALGEPGIEISKVFRRVSAHVESASKGTQIPTVLGNWPAEDFYVWPK